jgi:hypothetical protein
MLNDVKENPAIEPNAASFKEGRRQGSEWSVIFACPTKKLS